MRGPLPPEVLEHLGLPDEGFDHHDHGGIRGGQPYELRGEPAEHDGQAADEPELEHESPDPSPRRNHPADASAAARRAGATPPLPSIPRPGDTA